MSITVNTEAGAATIEASTGRVIINGGSMLSHEAAAMASAIFQAANEADQLAAKVRSEALQNVVPF